MSKGKFIVFEGLDGAGSTEQAELLRGALEERGLKVLLTKEPTNNVIGGIIRGALTKDWLLSNKGMQLLFCADREHHLQRDILPSLERGEVVICDRYIFSTLAFGALESDMWWLRSLNSDFPPPDLTFILDVDPEFCIQKLNQARFSFELFGDYERLEKVRSNYKLLAKEYSNTFIIDATKDKDSILNEILSVVDKSLLE